jgi:hypothetical protein
MQPNFSIELVPSNQIVAIPTTFTRFIPGTGEEIFFPKPSVPHKAYERSRSGVRRREDRAVRQTFEINRIRSRLPRYQ